MYVRGDHAWGFIHPDAAFPHVCDSPGRVPYGLPSSVHRKTLRMYAVSVRGGHLIRFDKKGLVWSFCRWYVFYANWVADASKNKRHLTAKNGRQMSLILVLTVATF